MWTTTPWTLVSNAAVAVDPELNYVRARAEGGPVQIVASAGGAGAGRATPRCWSVSPAASWSAPATTRRSVHPGEAYGPKGHTVLPADFVTAEDGTGLVHTAIAFGEDDFRLGEQQGLTVVNPVRPDGTYDERIGPYAGRWVKDADPDLIEDLRARGRLLRAESYEHSYPHCWRCGTPLLYYAKPSWYIATSQIKDRLLASNETVNWHPEHVKHGRFGNWLEGNVDWALSRERYWGTPLPVWRCEHGCTTRDRIVRRAATSSPASQLDDPHRPFVDEVTFPCENCGGDMHRVPEVIDVWFDSGSMPFAQFHAPHAEHRALRAALPGRLRLRGAGPDARLVLLAAGDLDPAVRPLVVSQRRLPGADPRRAGAQDVQVAGQHRRAVGADRPLRRRRAAVVLLHLQAALGWLPLLAGDDRRGGAPVPAAAVEHLRLLRPVRQRQRASHPRPVEPVRRPTSTAGSCPGCRRRSRSSRDRLDDFDATTAGRAIQAFVDELSNWYVRRSRRRFWEAIRRPSPPCASAWSRWPS